MVEIFIKKHTNNYFYITLIKMIFCLIFNNIILYIEFESILSINFKAWIGALHKLCDATKEGGGESLVLQQ